jgi:hypothetical protein
MAHSWNTTELKTEEQIFDVLLDLGGKHWLSRGQSRRYDELVPSIDRDGRKNQLRHEMLVLERQSIDLFRLTARFFSGPGEQGAMVDEIVTMMVLRHYGVPTRLLDWTRSPYVAAYFATCCYESEDGEIWSFDEPKYEEAGKIQWKNWPETTSNGSGDPDKFDAKLTAFALQEPPDWIVCGFYPTGFPRQDAQSGAYSLTARFGRDHAEAIKSLLADDSRYHLYIVSKEVKEKLRATLREKYGIWRGSLFPDTAGAADTAHQVFKVDGSKC